MNDKTLHVLSTLDRQILNRLQQDASITNQALAELLQVSAATCLRRVRHLEALGILERRVALVQPQRLAELMGEGLTVLVEVTLDKQGSEWLSLFEATATRLPQVQQCYRVSPGPDFVLVLHVWQMSDYHALANQLLSEHQNVRNLKAFFCTHRAKFEPAVVLPLV